jgi:hypothetical protein
VARVVAIRGYRDDQSDERDDGQSHQERDGAARRVEPARVDRREKRHGTTRHDVVSLVQESYGSRGVSAAASGAPTRMRGHDTALDGAGVSPNPTDPCKRRVARRITLPDAPVGRLVTLEHVVDRALRDGMTGMVAAWAANV